MLGDLFTKMFLYNLVCVAIFIKSLPASNTEKYCGADVCNNTKQHTLCKFQSEDPAQHCIDWEPTIKTWRDKQDILDKLNERRNKVAAGQIRSLPSADNINKLEWSSELETSAQRWANQCVKHSVPDIKDTCRDLEVGIVGQSIATVAGEAPGLTPAALVDVWYMELLNLNASVVPNYVPSAVTGFPPYDYFTQLVWAESTHVGCGGVKFKERILDLTREKNRTIYRLVCNFYPSGNQQNQPVYTSGKPCSKCRQGGHCDTLYKALCAPKSTTSKTTTKRKSSMITIISKIKSNVYKTRTIKLETNTTLEESDNPTTTEDNFTPFDYFSHLHEFVRPTLTTTATTPIPCKDISAVDDFIELLKKKLSSDPLLKELLPTTKFVPENFSDASVAEFVSSLYGRKTTPWSTAATSDFVNSTLLVDLVEAVIFRSGGDKLRLSYSTDHRTQHMSDEVPAIKVQAELGEVRKNTDFTGHYFFPEDAETSGDETSEITDTYYDANTPKASDVFEEIENIKRNKHTKDFLDEILESDEHTESKARYTPILIKEEKDDNSESSININEELTRIKREHGFSNEKNIKQYNSIQLKSLESNQVKLDYRSCHVRYMDLLKQLASDLGVLNLNARFHCVTSSAAALLYPNYFLSYFILIYAFV